MVASPSLPEALADIATKFGQMSATRQPAGACFLRNGWRTRECLSIYSLLRCRMPRVICSCGGSVSIPFTILRRHQRIWDDVTEQIGRWADCGLSLGQMRTAIGEQMSAQVGLRTLNRNVQAVRIAPALELTSCPPVVMLDAIWVTLLEDTGKTRMDSRHRQLPVKARRKVCVLVALGLYPRSQR